MVLGLVLVIFCTMGGTAFATEIDNVDENELKTDVDPIVIVEDTDISVPDSVIQELINENPKAGQIVITEYGKCNIKQSNMPMQVMSPGAGVFYSNVSKTQLDSDILARINFVTSVARGESKVLGNSWSSTLSCNISGKIDSYTLGITSNLTVNYSQSQTFNGPSETSPYNSRSFYVKFYENKGTYTATCHDPLAGCYIKYPVSGTYTEPAYYISYNIDTIVSN